MQLTPNYNLKKPEGTDPVDIQDFNDNADVVDAALKKKAESSGGDISEMTVKTLDNITTDFPVPVAGEKPKTFLGKVKKFFEDTKNWMTGVCLIGSIVNNCVTDNAKLPLSAAQGKALMDLYTVLNTNLDNRTVVADLIVEADAGPIGKRIINCGDNTHNTPYKAGLTTLQSGTAIISMSSANYGTILYIAAGAADTLFLRAKANGTWGDWFRLRSNRDSQGGTVSITPTAVNQPAYKTITFPMAFAAVPSVTVTPMTSSPNMIFASVANITSTGCRIYISRSDAAHAASVAWIAIMR